MRDENFWAIEAQRLRLIGEIRLAALIRCSVNANDDGYAEFIDALEDELRTLEGKRLIAEEKAEANWEFLKMKKRG